MRETLPIVVKPRQSTEHPDTESMANTRATGLAAYPAGVREFQCES
jgi:hypothetical protein